MKQRPLAQQACHQKKKTARRRSLKERDLKLSEDQEKKGGRSTGAGSQHQRQRKRMHWGGKVAAEGVLGSSHTSSPPASKQTGTNPHDPCPQNTAQKKVFRAQDSSTGARSITAAAPAPAFSPSSTRRRKAARVRKAGTVLHNSCRSWPCSSEASPPARAAIALAAAAGPGR